MMLLLSSSGSARRRLWNLMTMRRQVNNGGNFGVTRRTIMQCFQR